MKECKRFGLMASALVSLFALFATGSEDLSATTAKRSEARCKEVMSTNDYVGVWEDRTYSDLFKMTLMECGEGDLLSQGCCYPVRWSVDKDGLVKCQIHTEKEDVFDAVFRYIPKTDELNAVPKDGAAELPEKALGRLKYIGKPEVDKPVAKRDESDLGPAKLERMIREKDKSLRVLASVDDLPDVWNLMQTRTAWATLDFTYPRLSFEPDGICKDWMDVTIFTGAYESSELSGKRTYCGRMRKILETDKPVTKGWTREEAEKFRKALEGNGVNASLEAIDFTGRFSYWRADAITLTLFDKEGADRLASSLKEFLRGMQYPRYYHTGHVPLSDKMKKIWDQLDKMPKGANGK